MTELTGLLELSALPSSLETLLRISLTLDTRLEDLIAPEVVADRSAEIEERRDQLHPTACRLWA